MTLDADTRKKLIDQGRENLVKVYEINESGYAGVNSKGTIVDRREFPDAVPVQKNDMLGVPSPKPILSQNKLIVMLKRKALEIRDFEVKSQFMNKLGDYLQSINWKAEYGMTGVAVVHDQQNDRLNIRYRYLHDMNLRTCSFSLLTSGSYYEDLGLELPKKAKVKVGYMEGLKFYLEWIDCPDKENILYGWIKTKKAAEEIAVKHKWDLQN